MNILLRFCYAACCGCILNASLMHGAERQLRYAAILMRHGVRSPTWTADRLNGYSAEPWPDWGVAPGYLTPHGEAAMKLLGSYDRAYFSHAGLLSGSCSDAARIYIWADTDQRTVASGRALATGLLPDCQVDVHFQDDGKHDALFNPAKSDTTRAVAAFAGRIGGHPEALREVYASAFQALERVLGKPLPPEDGDQPLSPVSTLAEDFLLEYTNGMTGKQTWLGPPECVESSRDHGAAFRPLGPDAAYAVPCTCPRFEPVESPAGITAPGCRGDAGAWRDRQDGQPPYSYSWPRY